MAHSSEQHAFKSDLDSRFAQYVAAGNAPGIAYGVVRSGALEFGGGVGACATGAGAPTIDTQFPIASLSKSFFACAALIAQRGGHLLLTDPITRHVPEFVLQSPADPEVPTIEMLLGMCGGLTEDNSWIDPLIDMPRSEVLGSVSKGVRLSRPVGAGYEYSNLGYALVAVAIERAVGTPIREYVRRELIEPLGLDSTCFDSDVIDNAGVARGYRREGVNGWREYDWKRSDGMLGACGLVSTVRDLATWIAWLSEAFQGNTDDNKTSLVLSLADRRDAQRVRIMQLPMLGIGARGMITHQATGYALGIKVSTDPRHGLVLSHTGGLPGYTLAMAWHPGSGSGAIVLSNSNCSEAVARCADALERSLESDSRPSFVVRLWPETVELRDKAETLIRAWDDALAASIFAPNIDHDEPLRERRAKIRELRREVGPLRGTRSTDISSASPAEAIWIVRGKHGSIACRIHVTPTTPARIQELTLVAHRDGMPMLQTHLALLAARPLNELVIAPGLSAETQRP